MALTAGTVPQNMYAAYAFDVGEDLTVDCVACTAHTTGYASAALALAALPAVAADHVRLGTLVLVSSDAGGFIAGTTAISAVAVTEVFADSETIIEGVIAQRPA